MVINKFFIFNIFFTSLFYLSFCQSPLRSQINIGSFIKCVSEKIEKMEINDIPLDDVLSLLITSQTKDYKKLQEKFTKHFKEISPCLKGQIPKFPDGTSFIDLDSIFKEKYDWNSFITCILDKIIDIDMENSPFEKLIDLINEGKYSEALREEFKLRNSGNNIIKSCTATKRRVLENKK